MNWFQTQKARFGAWTLKMRQERKLAEHAVEEQRKTAEFLQSLGERISRESLPTRCDAVYEAVLKWAGDCSFKQKQAALFLFLWEVEEKKKSLPWEVSDIANDLEQMQYNEQRTD